MSATSKSHQEVVSGSSWPCQKRLPGFRARTPSLYSRFCSKLISSTSSLSAVSFCPFLHTCKNFEDTLIPLSDIAVLRAGGAQRCSFLRHAVHGMCLELVHVSHGGFRFSYHAESEVYNCTAQVCLLFNRPTPVCLLHSCPIQVCLLRSCIAPVCLLHSCAAPVYLFHSCPTQVCFHSAG